jgi:glucose-1-phosphate adenylyltransferase
MKVVSVILAGGQGSRLYPLTKVRSKPAVPVAGRFRLIDISISNCIHSNVRNIFVLTQFASESLHRHIFTTYRFDAFHRDYITLLSAQQTLENRNWYQGTADAVRQNLDFIEEAGALVLVLSGDHLYRMDYGKFVDFHIAAGAEISIAVTPVRADQAHEFGVMKVNGRGRITEFFEKPKEPADVDRMRADEAVFGRFGTPAHGRTHLASMGVYLFNQDVLRDLLAATDTKDFGREVIPRAIGERKVFAHFFDGYWEDIGTIRSFFEAHMDLTRPLPKFDFYDEARPIFTFPRFLPGSKILGAAVENAILCEGSIVNRSTIRDSIVGIRSRIGEGPDRAGVIMGSDFYESRGHRPKPRSGRRRGYRPRLRDPRRHRRQERPDRPRRQAHQRPGRGRRDGRQLLHRRRHHRRPKGAIIPDGTII